MIPRDPLFLSHNFQVPCKLRSKAPRVCTPLSETRKRGQQIRTPPPSRVPRSRKTIVPVSLVAILPRTLFSSPGISSGFSSRFSDGEPTRGEPSRESQTKQAGRHNANPCAKRLNPLHGNKKKQRKQARDVKPRDDSREKTPARAPSWCCNARQMLVTKKKQPGARRRCPLGMRPKYSRRLVRLRHRETGTVGAERLPAVSANKRTRRRKKRRKRD